MEPDHQDEEAVPDATTTSAPEVLPQNLSTAIKAIVQSNVHDSLRDIQGSLGSQRQDEPHFAPMVEAMHDLEALGEGLPFPRLPATALSSSVTAFENGFTPDIPATFVHTIQSREFFEMSKLLAENLHGQAALTDSFHLAVGSDSTLRLQKGLVNAGSTIHCKN